MEPCSEGRTCRPCLGAPQWRRPRWGSLLTGRARQVRAGGAGGDQRALAVLQVVQREREARVQGVCQDRRAGARASASPLSCGAGTMCGGTHTDARQPVPTLTCKQLPDCCVQVDEEEMLVCVLIDEVESLTAARRAAVAGSEPADVCVRSTRCLRSWTPSSGVQTSWCGSPPEPGSPRTRAGGCSKSREPVQNFRSAHREGVTKLSHGLLRRQADCKAVHDTTDACLDGMHLLA